MGPVTSWRLLSTPSMLKLLFVGRWPPTDGPVPYPMPPLCVTPGASRLKFKTPVSFTKLPAAG